MIIIRSNHDLQNSYLYYYTNEIIDFASKKNYKPVILENREITQENLRKRIKTKRPNFIFFNGHGSDSALYDYYNKPFIDSKSADVFDQTITFARACDSLKVLAKEAVNKGCLAFVGYKNKFFIARLNSETCKPINDPVAKPALESSNIIMKELIKGKTVREAIESSHNLAADSILKLIYSKELWAGASLRALVYNDRSLNFEGDAEAKK